MKRHALGGVIFSNISIVVGEAGVKVLKNSAGKVIGKIPKDEKIEPVSPADAAGKAADAWGGHSGYNWPIRRACATDAAKSGAAGETRGGGTYLLRDAETGQVMRTGRINNRLRRQAEHARDPLLSSYDVEPVHRTDLYQKQRGLEQPLHDRYNQPMSKRKQINPTNPNRSTYLKAAQNDLNQQGGG